MRESWSVALLGLTIESRLTFKDHINILFKLYGLRSIRKGLTSNKAKLLYNVFVNRPFNYASIIMHNLDVLS